MFFEAAAAAGFVGVGVADLHAFVAAGDALAVEGWGSAADADGVDFVDEFGDRHQAWDGAEGFASEVHVEAYYVQQTGCRKKSGDYYHASGSGSRWNEGLGGYVSSGPTYSDHLRFW